MNTKIEIRDRSWKSLRDSGPIEKVIPFAASVAALAAAILLLPSAAWAGGVVTNCTEPALRAAMAGGGVVTFACDGTITLANLGPANTFVALAIAVVKSTLVILYFMHVKGNTKLVPVVILSGVFFLLLLFLLLAADYGTRGWLGVPGR